VSDDLKKTFSTSDSDKLDLILSALQHLQEDLHIVKCEIKTSVREVALHQDAINNSLIKVRVNLRDIDERLHGIELNQQRQNSST
jgi:hypothetical protein